MSQNIDFHVTGGQELFPGIWPYSSGNMTAAANKYDTGVQERRIVPGPKDNGLQ
jgi:hypothetical protein